MIGVIFIAAAAVIAVIFGVALVLQKGEGDLQQTYAKFDADRAQRREAAERSLREESYLDPHTGWLEEQR